MEKILSPEQASMVDQALSLVRKAIQINRSPKNYSFEAQVEYTCYDWFEFRIWKKDSQTLLMNQTVHFNYEFEEKYLTINRVFSYILKHGIMPENYPAYENK